MMSPSRPSSTAVGDLGVDRLRRQQHGDAARLRDRVEVDGGQEAGPHVPDAGLRLLEVGGQADHRPGGACGLRVVRNHAPAPSRSRRRRRPPARRARCSGSGRRPRRRTPRARPPTRANSVGRLAQRRRQPLGATGVRVAGERHRLSSSSFSMPCRPPAMIAATARYWLTSPPGTRFSTRSRAVADHPQRAGAVVDAPGDGGRREAAVDVALVGVDVRREEQRQLAQRGEQAGDQVLDHRRHAVARRRRPSPAARRSPRTERWMWQLLPSRSLNFAMKVRPCRAGRRSPSRRSCRSCGCRR